MSLRIRHVADLPPLMRAYAASVLAHAPVVPRAATQLGLERLREERERLQCTMLSQLRHVNLAHLFVTEYRFHPERRWRLDLYSAAHRLGVELHGGLEIYGKRSHIGAGNKGGFALNREKMNAAVELGIRVLEYTPAALADGSALAQIERILAQS